MVDQAGTLFYICSIELRSEERVNSVVKTPERLFTVMDQGEVVSIVRARDVDSAIYIAENLLEFCRPDHEPLQARSATALESRRFFEDAYAWSGGVILAGIVLTEPLANTLH
jgi:hypothetical protein